MTLSLRTAFSAGSVGVGLVVGHTLTGILGSSFQGPGSRRARLERVVALCLLRLCCRIRTGMFLCRAPVVNGDLGSIKVGRTETARIFPPIFCAVMDQPTPNATAPLSKDTGIPMRRTSTAVA